MVNKKELFKKFSNGWEKHYNLEIFKDEGFRRQKCKICGRHFWSIEEREICGECEGYNFIGKKNKEISYVETWKIIEKYFVENGHTYIKPYPTVARWRDDLYFTIASINDFQPYVVNGELEPPANPLIIPQPCIRFNDIPNVGITGRHYTNFVMIGQHAFNKEKLFYWKEEAIKHDINYLKKLGLKKEKIVFMEDVWVGGGNFGPSIEYFYDGLELGNCVFMQYEETENGFRELKTKVIDMGAGLSRLAWINNGTPNSYEVVFGDLIKKMKKEYGIKIDKKIFLEYSKLASSLNFDEVGDLEKEKEKIAKKIGIDKNELFEKIEKLQAIYSIADHTLTTLFTVKDGMFPSNSGGGYNLRIILRRAFDFEEKFDFDVDYYEILKYHSKHLNYMFPDLKEAIESTNEIIKEEKKKYNNTKEKLKRKIKKIPENIGLDELKKLYESEGITPEMIKKYKNIKIPADFYVKIRKKPEKAKKKNKYDVSGFEKTKILYYEPIEKFEAKVLGFIKEYVILDKTAFYPEGGGQIWDTGTINGFKVEEVIKVAGVVLHKIKNHNLKIGDKIIGIVDLKRRKQISKNHTAAHIINAAARNVLGNHVWQAGSGKNEEKGHLDITHYKRITEDELKEIEKKANEFVMENKPIITEILLRNVAEQKYGFRLYQGGAIPGKELRIVNIPGIDVEACGGTHYMNKHTGELGLIKIIKRESVKDGVERITFTSGIKAIEYIQKQEEILKKASSNLKVDVNELEKTTKRFFEEWKERGKRIESLSKELIKIKEREILEKENYEGEIDVDAKTLLILGNKLKGKVNAIIYNKEGNIIFISKNKDALEMLKNYRKKVKGGGGKKLAIGKIY